METKETLVLLYNAVVVTMDQECHVIRDGAVAIMGDCIKAVGPTSQILADFSNTADESIDLNGRFLLPGIVTLLVFDFIWLPVPVRFLVQRMLTLPVTSKYLIKHYT